MMVNRTHSSLSEKMVKRKQQILEQMLLYRLSFIVYSWPGSCLEMVFHRDKGTQGQAGSVTLNK